VRDVLDGGELRQLHSIILVDCGVTSLPALDSVAGLETLDVRRNRVRALPASVSQCRRLRTLRVSHNAMRQLPDELGQLDVLTTLDCAFNRLKRLSTHIVRCAHLRRLQVRSPVSLSHARVHLPRPSAQLSAARFSKLLKKTFGKS